MAPGTSLLLAAHRALAPYHAALEPCVLRAHGQALRTELTQRPRLPPSASLLGRATASIDHHVRRFVGEHLYYASEDSLRINRRLASLLGTGGAGYCLYPYRPPLVDVGKKTTLARENNQAYRFEHQYGRLAAHLAEAQGIVAEQSESTGWRVYAPSFSFAVVTLLSAWLGLLWRKDCVTFSLLASVAHSFVWHLEDWVWPRRRLPSYPPIVPPSSQEVQQVVSERLLRIWQRHREEQAAPARRPQTRPEPLAQIPPYRAHKLSLEHDHPLMASMSTAWGTNPLAHSASQSDDSEQARRFILETSHKLAKRQEALCWPWSELLTEKLVQRKLFGKLPYTVLGTQAFMLLITDPRISVATNHLKDRARREMMFCLRYEDVPVQWQTRDKSPIDADCSLLGEPQLFIYLRPQSLDEADGYVMRSFFDPSGVYRP